jgi:hypothetical protein
LGFCGFPGTFFFLWESMVYVMGCLFICYERVTGTAY